MYGKRRHLPPGALLLALAALTSCNAITGVDDLKVVTEPPLELHGVEGVTVNEISLYQGIKIPLMTGGMRASSDIPVVIGRDGLLRVYVTTDAAYDGEEVLARLTIDGKDPLEVTTVLPGAPAEDVLESTLNFEVPGASIAAGMKYKLEIGRMTKEGSAPIAYPAKDLEEVPVVSAGKGLKLVIAPIKYDADGSGRLPDLSTEQIDFYKNAFRGMYPVPDVEISVRDPIPYKNPVSAFGGGWGELLDYVAQVRQSDGVSPDTYYYGAFEPADSFNQFCGGGCVLGLGLVGMSASDGYSRAAVGVGWAGRDAIETALHEIGHNHGRQHAPCDTQDADPQYPHPGGQDGVWGYDPLRKQLFAPEIPDIMGYCVPLWISDYTYKGLLTRIQAVNGARVDFPAEMLDRTWDRVLIEGDTVKWLGARAMHTPPMAEERSVDIEAGGALSTVTGHLYPFDHLDGGILFLPTGADPTDAAWIDVAGKSIRVTP